jgi:UrcA family protein
MLTMNTKTFRLAAGAALVLLAALPALPAQADDSITKVVSLRGLDLSSPADQAVLRHRLQVAAWNVCTTSDGVEGGFDGCRKAAFGTAWAQAQPMIAAARSRSLFGAAEPGWAQPKTLVAASSPATQGAGN